MNSGTIQLPHDPVDLPFGGPVVNVELTGTAKVVGAGSSETVILLRSTQKADPVVEERFQSEKPQILDRTSSGIVPGLNLRVK